MAGQERNPVPVNGPGRRGFLKSIAAIGAGAAAPGLIGAFMNTASAAQAVPLRATIDAAHPAHLINFGQDDQLNGDTTAKLWSTVPDYLKPYVYINLIPGANIHNVPAQTDWIAAELAFATAHQIPVTVQVAHGQTGTTDRIPVAQWETWAAANPVSLKGFNAAELYNGPDQSGYLIDLFNLAGRQGMFFFWTDTNIFGTNGMMLDYMQNNGAFLPAMKANAANLVLLNKESFATDTTDALLKGLWLTGHIGNWGGSTDWWKWGLDGRGVFPGGSGGQDWKYILQYPQGLQMQSIVRDMSQGATVFLCEASFFTNGAWGHRYAGAHFGVYPLLYDVVRGRIKIPTRAQVAAQTLTVAKGKSAYTTPGWNGSVNNAMASDGRYGMLPLVPTTMPAADLSPFTTVTAAQPKSYYDNLYPGYATESDAWLVRTDTAVPQWFYTNPYMGVQRKAFATFTPAGIPGASVTISADEHSNVIVSEGTGSLGFHAYNHRLDLTNALSQVTDKPTTFQFGQNYMAPVMDPSGNPVVNADGTIPTVGGHTLPDRSARDIRNVTVAVRGTWNGGRPVVVFDDYAGVTRPYTQTQTWDAGTKTLTLALTMNGVCNFNVKVDGPGAAFLPTTGWSVKYADSEETSGENGAAANVLDGDRTTIWHTRYTGAAPVPAPPHEIQIDMGSSKAITGFAYLPRQDGSVNGRVGRYEFYVSSDGTTWGSPVAAGTFTDDAGRKTVGFPSTTARYLRFRALTAVDGGPYTTCATLSVIGS